MIINTVEIDGKDYDEVDIITIGDVKYAYLVDSYEEDDDAEDVKAGSFYTTPNGMKTSFSFFREDNEEYYEPLKSKDEYDNALIEFYHKHKDLVDKAN